MTRKEYIDYMGMSEEEAEKHLIILPFLTWATVLSVIGLRVLYATYGNLLLAEPVATTLYIAIAGLLLFWIIYCVRVPQKTNRSGFNVLFGIFIFPVGLLGFYPYLIRPLKIITGKIPPPEKIPTKKELSDMNKRAWKSTAKTVAIALGIGMIIMAILTVVIFITEGST